MTSVKDLERCARLFEKEVATLADQVAERESSLRIEIDRLRLDLEAIKGYLAERDPSFTEACNRGIGQMFRPPGSDVDE